MTAMTISGVQQHYGETRVLWDVNLDIPEGRCTCLMGRNGVGKTTLLKTIMGLCRASAGSIRFGTTELAKKPAEERARLGIAYVPQGREIFPMLTVEENLRLGFPASRSKRKAVDERVFEWFPVLKKMLKRRGGDLSGGQQQQLAIGRAMGVDPTLLILDEPTEGIQPNIVDEIAEVVQRVMTEQGITVLLVEQKLPFARRLAHSFCVMEKGRTVRAGAIDELTDDVVKRHLTV